MEIRKGVMLTEHFSLKELTYSDKALELGIDNTAPHDIIKVGYKTALELEKLRTLLGKPMKINSWYRCLKLNRALGSKDSSQHPKGEAVDFVCTGFGTPLEICKEVLRHKDKIPFDQLILEHSWVHISFAILNGHPKGEVLSLLATGKYAPGLTNSRGVPYN